mgnify:CR=1 FL=1
MISRDKIREVLERMSRIGIAREDLDESFIRGSGNGGQKINKTSSTVRLKHAPSGIDVKCQDGRSLAANRYNARVLLCEKLEQIIASGKSATQAAASLKRRQNRKRSKNQKAILVKEKRHRGNVKSLRRKPDLEG